VWFFGVGKGGFILNKKSFKIGIVCILILLALCGLFAGLFHEPITEEVAKQQEDILKRQEEIQANLVCPICDGTHFFESDLYIRYDSGLKIDSYDPKCYTCKTCGYVVFFNRSVTSGDTNSVVEQFSLEE